MLTYLTLYPCKPEHHINVLCKKVSKEAYNKKKKEKMFIGNIFWIKREVLTHEAIRRLLSMLMRHSNNDVVYIFTGVKRIQM